MLRFLASVIGCVAILSGMLLGWVRYAQHDPEYSCLSFDNITVQLDTSLFMRQYYPIVEPRSLASPDLTKSVIIEAQADHVNRLSPKPIGAQHYLLKLMDLNTGETFTFKEIKTLTDLGFWWSMDSQYLAYGLNMYSKYGEFGIMDTAGNSRLHIRFNAKVFDFIGWSPDARYFLFYLEYTDGGSDHPVLVKVDTQTWQHSQIALETFYPVDQDIILQNRHIAFISDDTLHIVELDTEQIRSRPLVMPLSAFVHYSWSSNERYLAVSYIMDQSEGGINEPTDYYRTQVFDITTPDLAEVSIYDWHIAHNEFPQWAVQSDSLYFIVWETPMQDKIVRYDIHTQQTEIIFEQAATLNFVENYLLIDTSYSADPEIFEVHDEITQEILYRQEAYYYLTKLALPPLQKFFPVIELQNQFPFVYLKMEGRNGSPPFNEIYQVNLETHKSETLFSGLDSRSAVIRIESAWIEVIEITTNDIRLHSLNLNTLEKRTYTIPQTSPMATFSDVAFRYQPTVNSWLIIIRDSTQKQSLVYQVDLTENKIEEIAVVPTDDYDYGSAIVSPDRKYVAVTLQDNITVSSQLYAVSLRDQQFHSLGAFPDKIEPIWTQCTY